MKGLFLFLMIPGIILSLIGILVYEITDETAWTWILILIGVLMVLLGGLVYAVTDGSQARLELFKEVFEIYGIRINDSNKNLSLEQPSANILETELGNSI